MPNSRSFVVLLKFLLSSENKQPANFYILVPTIIKCMPNQTTYIHRYYPTHKQGLYYQLTSSASTVQETSVFLFLTVNGEYDRAKWKIRPHQELNDPSL